MRHRRRRSRQPICRRNLNEAALLTNCFALSARQVLEAAAKTHQRTGHRSSNAPAQVVAKGSYAHLDFCNLSVINRPSCCRTDDPGGANAERRLLLKPVVPHGAREGGLRPKRREVGPSPKARSRLVKFRYSRRGQAHLPRQSRDSAPYFRSCYAREVFERHEGCRLPCR